MVRPAFLASALALEGIVAIGGCNTAQLSTPPPIDGGDQTCPTSPVFKTCEAGAPQAAPLCGAYADAAIPPGDYSVGCVSTTYSYDSLGDCIPNDTCTCVGVGDGGSPSWQCTP
jgi:hypothetical protein